MKYNFLRIHTMRERPPALIEDCQRHIPDPYACLNPRISICIDSNALEAWLKVDNHTPILTTAAEARVRMSSTLRLYLHLVFSRTGDGV